MQIAPALGAGTAFAVCGWLLLAVHEAPPATASAGQPADRTAASPAAQPLQPPVSDGHLVLVVEGDRDGLGIAFARHKGDPWAGVPKGLTSAWQLTLEDARGAMLATVPLDVSAFATGAHEQHRPARVEGCVVRDPRIAMLVSVPAFAAAARYRFTRRERDGATVQLGVVDGAHVRALVEGGR